MDALQKAEVTHDEFKQGIRFLAQVQEAKEIPLLLMVFLEARHIFRLDEHLDGSQGTVLGPYFKPEAARVLERPYRLPMRDQEPGDPLFTTLTITDVDGRPIEG